MPRTKIICTIGPSVNSVDKLVALIHSGMNVARLNFSHGVHADHLKAIEQIKEARQKTGKPVAIMLDTKGPEIRLGLIERDQLELRTGQRWFLSKENVLGNSESVTLTPAEVLDHLEVGNTVLFDNGYITSRVAEKKPEGVFVEIFNSGIIRSRKGVNIPDIKAPLPAFTQKDEDDIRFGCLHGIDMIAASFVRSAEHIMLIKQLLSEIGRPEVLVLAKIENREGLEQFDNIIRAADGVMIARGDLGVEIPIYEVPAYQKMMIRAAYLAGKPSVTATQMLESMISNPRPTRAEVSDVANAIYDSTSAVMLSGETAVGAYPNLVVEVMRSVVEATESHFDNRTFLDYHTRFVYRDVPSALTLATVKTAYSANAKAIFCFTKSGSTARLLARLRPSIPIIAMTDNECTYQQMSLFWGVIPYLNNDATSIEEAKQSIARFAIDNKWVNPGDLVIITAGSPFGLAGSTNTMIVENV